MPSQSVYGTGKVSRAKLDEIDTPRLCQSIERSRLVLQKYREERREAVRAYVGKHYSDRGSSDKMPVNMLAQYVQVMSRSLVSKNPRAILSTFNRKHKPAVRAMQEWLNKHLEKIDIAETLQRIVVDALFSVGIAKVSIVTPEYAASAGYAQVAGETCIERVSPDDWVVDTRASELKFASFMGHRFRIPLSVAKEVYGKSQQQWLQETDYTEYNREGDERLAALSFGTFGASTEDDYEQMVDLWEIYLPRHKLVVTLSDGHLGGSTGSALARTMKPLRVVEWLGPDCGPYHMLSLGVVPDNLMPAAPIQNLVDLNDALNKLVNKAIRQSVRQKELLLVAGSAAPDGTRIVEAEDGQAIRVDAPDRAQVANFGGPNAVNVQMAANLKDLFSQMAGGQDAAAGAKPQAKTLGQEKMLAAQSAVGVSDMVERTTRFVSKVMNAGSWFFWHDPFKVMNTLYSPGMSELQFENPLYPHDPDEQMRVQFGYPSSGKMMRSASWDEIDLKVDPYSLRHRTPEEKLGDLMGVVTQLVIPMMPVLSQQGISLEMNALLGKVAQYLDMPDLSEILTYQDQQQSPEGRKAGVSHERSMPTETTRTYERVGTGGDSPQAREQEMMNAFAGAGAEGAGQVMGFGG